MAQKHLHELLQEDQEPFHLKSYIADRRSQLKTSTQLTLKKPKPISPASSTFCKKACFFSFTNSPDLTKSPLFEFKSPVRSPCKSPNNVFLHVPSRTAAVLLDAALRIQNNNASRLKNSGFGLFGSMLKKLKQKSKTNKSSVKDKLKWESFVSRKSNNACELSNGRPSSAVWSESNEETKSVDMDCSSSGSSTTHSDFCGSPFHFVLQRSPSPGRSTPEFSSPAASPGPHYRKQEKESFEDVKSSKVFEDDDDKDQFSPVSVLDPPFEDYEERQDGDYEDDDEEYGIQCSYENVQRAKKQLLQKLHRFEKLAGLNPIELEKRISEQENCDDETNDNEFDLSDEIYYNGELVKEVCQRANLFRQHCVSKRLISDLVAEEEHIENGSIGGESTVERVCERLESWKHVEYNTIDMMVEHDLRRDHDWKNYKNHAGGLALEVELAIFGLLVDEFSKELMQ